MSVLIHNMAAMNAQRQFGINKNTKVRTTEKLSSGYRINRAGDDAAGLAISEKMRRQVRGLTQATANLQDGIAFANVAEGALNEVSDMMNRLEELAVHAANGTLTEEDRSYIDAESQQLQAEMQRIFRTTEFNDKLVWPALDVPEVGGYIKDFSLYTVDGDYGGILYHDHRYSWEDLGIEYDAVNNEFKEDKEYLIDDKILKDDSSTTRDDYSHKGSSAVFRLVTKKGAPAESLEKYYVMSADAGGIYINGVLANGTKGSEEGNSTWAGIKNADGPEVLQYGQDVKKGYYYFNFYGQTIAMETSRDMTWDEFSDKYFNDHTFQQWTTEVERTDLYLNTKISSPDTKVLVDNPTKDHISSTYFVETNDTDIWVRSANGTYSAKTGWTALDNVGPLGGEYGFTSWGEDTAYAPDSKSDSIGTTDDKGSQKTTFSEDAVYTYHTNFLKTSESGELTFRFSAKDEASRENIVNDVDSVYFRQTALVSPTAVYRTNYTGKDFFNVSAMCSNINFYTQRDQMGRGFYTDTEDFGTRFEIQQDASTNELFVEVSGVKFTSGETIYDIMSGSAREGDIARVWAEEKIREDREKEAKGHTFTQSEAERLKIYFQYKLGSHSISFQNGKDSITLSYTKFTYKQFCDLEDKDQHINDFKTANKAAYQAAYGADYLDRLEADAYGSYLNTVQSKIDSRGFGGASKSIFQLKGDGQTYQRIAMGSSASVGSKPVMAPVIKEQDPDPLIHDLSIQAGAESGQHIEMSYKHMRLGTIGLLGMEMGNPDEASGAILRIKKAQRKVNDERAQFGAYTNRMEHAVNSNRNTTENTTAAESAIRDTDMAREMIQLSKQNILEQAGISMMSQANQNHQLVLSLLQ